MELSPGLRYTNELFGDTQNTDGLKITGICGGDNPSSLKAYSPLYIYK